MARFPPWTKACATLQLIWADAACGGRPFARWLQRRLGWRLKIARRKKGQKGFSVLSWRWIVERTLAWIGKNRRLSKDYEGKAETSEAWISLAMIRLMLRRLSK